MENGIGKPVRRKEDHRLLTGRGRFSDDFNLPGQAHAQMVRSQHAHARILSLDTEAARAAPGVLAVLTHADYLADGLASIPSLANPGHILDPARKSLANKDGSEIFLSPLYPLAGERVRHMGDGLALVVAETPEAAKDAAELVEIDYQVLPAVTDSADAVAPGAPQLWDQAPGNVCVDLEVGDARATDQAFNAAHHVTTLDLRNNRVSAVCMEPRAAVAEYDPLSGRTTLHAGSQGAVMHKKLLAVTLKLPLEKIRVISRDVGGGFGMRHCLYAEFVLVCWAARRLERPVKWVCERTEAFQADFQARDLITHAELALDSGGRFLGLRLDHLYNVGAYTVSFVPLSNGINLITDSYVVPCAHLTARAVFTNTLPNSPYRGAGRPEAIFNLERLIDTAAREMGLDQVEIRRRNLIAPAAFPYTNPTGIPFDCGEFLANMESTLKIAEWDGFAARKAQSRARGLLRGIGISNSIETPTGALVEWTRLSIEPGGGVEVIIGTGASGQGHETSFAQVVAEQLGVPFEAVRLVTGDTDVVLEGGGSHSDRSMRLAGTILFEAAAAIVEKGKRIASHLLEAAAADVEFADGRFTVKGTDRSLDIFEVAAGALHAPVPAEDRGPLSAGVDISRRLPAYPNGCAICEVEVDADTGALRIERYSTVDDVGRVINPLIVEGQIHGGIVQALGQALFEDLVYDRESGQILAGSFMDYCIPRADDLPFFESSLNEVLAPSNPLGIKGGGECGTTAALGATINAIVDALSEFGVKHIHMPATPERVWRAIQDAKAKRSATGGKPAP